MNAREPGASREPGDASNGPKAWCDPPAAHTLWATGLPLAPLPAKSQHTATALQLSHPHPPSSQEPPLDQVHQHSKHHTGTCPSSSLQQHRGHQTSQELVAKSPTRGSVWPEPTGPRPGTPQAASTFRCLMTKGLFLVISQHPWRVASSGRTRLCQRVLHQGQESKEDKEEEEEVTSSQQHPSRGKAAWDTDPTLLDLQE